MHQSKTNNIILLALLWVISVLPSSVVAAGLGQLNVSSAIGEPLKAHIELLSVTPAEMSTLKARIAPASAYAAQGLMRPALHSDIKINIAKRTNGKQFLRLQSNQAIEEPYLDMLVEVEWENGRVLRQYTALLDPPGYDRAVAVTQVQTPKVTAISKQQANNIAPIKEAKPSNTATPVKQKAAAEPVKTGDHLTRKGDTLSKIARRMKPEGVSLDQMLVALYDANKEAFVGGNMNRLKVGKIIQPPSAEALNAVTQQQATKKVRAQTADWKKYRRKLAEKVANATPDAISEDTQSASGKVQAAAEDRSVPDSTGPKDVVKLSTGEMSAEETTMQAKITSLQEEVSAREKGLQEAQDRIGALEKQIEDMQKLLTLKNDALSKAQSGEWKAPVEGEAATGTPETEVIETPTTEAVVEEAEMAKEAATEAVETATETASVEAPVPAVEAEPVAEAEPKPKPAPVVNDAPVEQPSFFAGLLDNITGFLGSLASGINTTLMAGAAGLIGLLAAAWFYLRHKRRKNLADFEQGIMTSGGLKANTVFGNTSGASVDTGDTSFLTDFSQSTSGGMIDTNDVDPIAEAEVYMAYGRDAQAEEILKDAISKEPKRYELHLKLLEMYASSKNVSAFETVSGELYTTLGAEDPTWAKVAAIGIKLEPNNPLYQAKAGVGDGTPAESVEANSAETGSVEGELDASDFADAPMAAESDLDFSLNDDPQDAAEGVVGAGAAAATVAAGVAGAAVAAVDDVLDVDEEVLDTVSSEDVLNVKDAALDFDMGDTKDAPVEEVVSEAAENLNFTQTMPNLDMPETTTAEEAVEGLAGTLEPAAAEQAPTLDMPDDLTLDMPEAAEDAPVLDASADEGLAFDMSSLEGDTINMEAPVEAAADSQVNGLDLSSLSLDVNEEGAAVDDTSEAPLETPTVDVADAAAPAGEESAEVDTKLELVTAYIDMEDVEGAKELLDEVLKEGGTNQRKRAEEILASLN